MKKIFLIIGIVSIIACLLFLLLAVLNMLGYYHLLDGTAEHYNRLHHRMNISFVMGIVLGIIATVCIIIRSKI